MAIQGFSPPPSPSPPSPSPPSPSPSPYYQLLECGSARLGRVKNLLVQPAPRASGLSQQFSPTLSLSGTKFWILA